MAAHEFISALIRSPQCGCAIIPMFPRVAVTSIMLHEVLKSAYVSLGFLNNSCRRRLTARSYILKSAGHKLQSLNVWIPAVRAAQLAVGGSGLATASVTPFSNSTCTTTGLTTAYQQTVSFGSVKSHSSSRAILHSRVSSHIMTFLSAGASVVGPVVFPDTKRHFHSWYYHSRQSNRHIYAMKSVEELAQYWYERSHRLSYINLAEYLGHLSLLVRAGRWNIPLADHTLPSSTRAASVSAASAKLVPVAPTAEQQEALLDLLQHVCKRLRSRVKWYEPHHGSLVLQNLASLHCTKPKLVDSVLARMAARIEEAYSVDLARTALALLAHNHPGPASWWASASASLTAKLTTGRVPPNCVSGLLVPMVRLRQLVPPTLVAAITQDVSQRYSQYSAKDLSRVLWALARVQAYKRHLQRQPLQAAAISLDARNEDNAVQQVTDVSAAVASTGSTPEGTPTHDHWASGMQAASQLVTTHHLNLMSAHMLQNALKQQQQDLHSTSCANVLRTFISAVGQLLQTSDARRCWGKQHANLLRMFEEASSSVLSSATTIILLETSFALSRVGHHPSQQFLNALGQAVASLSPETLTATQRIALTEAFRQLEATPYLKLPPAPHQQSS